MFKIILTNTYRKKAKRFFKHHQELINQYEKCLHLLEANPYHPSLRLHRLKGKLRDIYSVSINIAYRITIEFLIKDELIIPVDIGKLDEVYE